MMGCGKEFVRITSLLVLTKNSVGKVDVRQIQSFFGILVDIKLVAKCKI